MATVDRVGWFGRQATGSPISYRLVLLLTVADGRIVRDERIYDSTGVLERLEKGRLDKELRTAADVQRILLPRTEHAGAFWESAGDSLPCRAIGGDFFEFLELRSGDVGIVMGDVAGKGPAAALLAAMLQGMLAVEAGAAAPASTLSRLNRRLVSRGLGSRFATLVYGVLSPDGRFVYSNGGHNPPALRSTGGDIRRLETGGPILGTFADANIEEEILQLRHSDVIVMFTDGVTEARSAQDEEFGEERMFAALTADIASSPIALLNRTLTTIGAFCEGADQTDDITLTVTRFIDIRFEPASD